MIFHAWILISRVFPWSQLLHFFIVLCSNFDWIAKNVINFCTHWRVDSTFQYYCTVVIESEWIREQSINRNRLLVNFSYNSFFSLHACEEQKVNPQIPYQNHHHPNDRAMEVVDECRCCHSWLLANIFVWNITNMCMECTNASYQFNGKPFHFISVCLIQLKLLARVDKYGHISMESIHIWFFVVSRLPLV